jgi:fructose-1,6-bisphosphatase
MSMDQQELITGIEKLITQYESENYKIVGLIFQFFPFPDRPMDSLFMEWDGEKFMLKPEGFSLVFISPLSESS